MSNRKSLGVVVGVLGLLGASVALAAEKPAAEAPANDACAPRKITKKVDKPMAAAEKAFNAKQWDQVLASVAEAEAVPVEKSIWDQYWMHEFRGRAYLSQEKYEEAGKELSLGLDSPCMDAADKPARTRMLLQIAYRTKDYPKVIELGNKYLESNPDPDIGSYVGNAYYAINDFPNTRRIMTDVVAKQEAGSKTSRRAHVPHPAGRLHQTQRQCLRDRPARKARHALSEAAVLAGPHEPADGSDQEQQPAAQHVAPRGRQ